MAHILVVDDDPTLRGVVTDYLRAAGMTVTEAEDGPSALAAAARGDVSLMVLDLMLPGIDGLEVFRRLRAAGDAPPVIMLTAKAGEVDRILGLEVGADDYLTKPFSPRELVLRVQSVLRRATSSVPERAVVTDGPISVDLDARKAWRDDRPLDLTLREFDLLAHFMSHPDVVLSREALLGAVWGWEHGDPSTVTVHIRRLRGKIEDDPAAPARIATVWGRGYRWEPAGEQR